MEKTYVITRNILGQDFPITLTDAEIAEITGGQPSLQELETERVADFIVVKAADMRKVFVEGAEVPYKVMADEVLRRLQEAYEQTVKDVIEELMVDDKRTYTVRFTCTKTVEMSGEIEVEASSEEEARKLAQNEYEGSLNVESDFDMEEDAWSSSYEDFEIDEVEEE